MHTQRIVKQDGKVRAPTEAKRLLQAEDEVAVLVRPPVAGGTGYGKACGIGPRCRNETSLARRVAPVGLPPGGALQPVLWLSQVPKIQCITIFPVRPACIRCVPAWRQAPQGAAWYGATAGDTDTHPLWDEG